MNPSAFFLFLVIVIVLVLPAFARAPSASLRFLSIVLFLPAFVPTAFAVPLTFDLGQGLVYHRAPALPADLPPASPARPQPVVLDLRYATGDEGAGTALAAWLKFHAAPRTPVFVLANADTAPALRAAFADREHAAGLIVLGVASADFAPDLALESDPATARRAYDALTDAASIPALIAPPVEKPRNDESRLTAEWHPDRAADGKPALPPDHGKRAAAQPPSPTDAPLPLVDVPLQRAVQLHRSLLALKKL
jgi:hypothetical protein